MIIPCNALFVNNGANYVANLAFDQTNSFNRLSVFCLFAPSPQKYKSIFWGPLTLKSQNFDGFSGFLTGSCEGAYFAVRN